MASNVRQAKHYSHYPRQYWGPGRPIRGPWPRSSFGRLVPENRKTFPNFALTGHSPAGSLSVTFCLRGGLACGPVQSLPIFSEVFSPSQHRKKYFFSNFPRQHSPRRANQRCCPAWLPACHRHSRAGSFGCPAPLAAATTRARTHVHALVHIHEFESG